MRRGGRGLATPGAARWRGLPWGPAAPYSSSPQPLRIPAQGNLAPEPRLPQQGGCVSSLGGVPRARDGGGPAHGEGRQTSAPSAGLSTVLGSVVLRAEPRRGGRGRPPAPPAAVPPQPPSLHPCWACSYPGPFFPAVRRLDPDALPPALQPALSPGHLGTTGFLLGKPAGRPACPPPGPSRRHSEVTWWGRPGPSAAAPRPRGPHGPLPRAGGPVSHTLHAAPHPRTGARAGMPPRS